MVKSRRKIVLCVNCCIAGSGEVKAEHEVAATDLHPDLQSLLEQWIEPELEDPLTVCGACSSTTYAMIKGRSISISREYDEVNEDSISNEYVRNMIKQARPDTIYLPNYRVLSASSNYCLYKGCKNSNRKIVPPVVREMVLTNYKIYVSSHSSICYYHLNLCDWYELTRLENFKRLFRTHEIEDAFALITKERVYGLVNFDDVENIPVNICRYFTGLSITDFLELHNSIQWNTYSSKQALATLLIKLKTGDSFERIAVLMGLSETHVKKLFYIACKSLEKSDCKKREQFTTDAIDNKSDSVSCSSDDVPLSHRINIQANNMLQENYNESNNVNRRSSSDNKCKITKCNSFRRHSKKNKSHNQLQDRNFVDSGDNFRPDDRKQLNENIDNHGKNASNERHSKDGENSMEVESLNNNSKSINMDAREVGEHHHHTSKNNDENRDTNMKRSNCNIDYRSKQELDERREDFKCESEFEVEYLDEMFL